MIVKTISDSGTKGSTSKLGQKTPVVAELVKVWLEKLKGQILTNSATARIPTLDPLVPLKFYVPKI